MDIVEKKEHKDKIQNFLDTGEGQLIVTIRGEKYYITTYDIMKTYIEEQDLKNDYLEKKILELEEKLDGFKYSYEFDKKFDSYLKEI